MPKQKRTICSEKARLFDPRNPSHKPINPIPEDCTLLKTTPAYGENALIGNDTVLTIPLAINAGLLKNRRNGLLVTPNMDHFLGSGRTLEMSEVWK